MGGQDGQLVEQHRGSLLGVGHDSSLVTGLRLHQPAVRGHEKVPNGGQITVPRPRVRRVNHWRKRFADNRDMVNQGHAETKGTVRQGLLVPIMVNHH
jgi:hypothetical protein